MPDTKQRVYVLTDRNDNKITEVKSTDQAALDLAMRLTSKHGVVKVTEKR